jgi:hypothetical protein
LSWNKSDVLIVDYDLPHCVILINVTVQSQLAKRCVDASIKRKNSNRTLITERHTDHPSENGAISILITGVITACNIQSMLRKIA